MNRLVPALLATCLLLAAGGARADAAAELVARLDSLQSLSGRFIQHQYPEGGGEPLASTGTFKLLRPGYFTWDIATPDSQLIVATQEYLWHYDRDLETVTRRPVDDSAGMSPLQVLGGDEAALRERYQVEALAGEAAGDFRLEPRGEEAGFRSLDIHFEDESVAGMSIVDNLGQRVEVEFTTVLLNPALGPADFAFTPPPGADLMYHDQ